MGNNTAERKSKLRLEMRARLSEITPQARRAASAEACAQLISREPWLKACSILLYAPFGNELDVWPLVDLGFKAGKQVSLPQYAGPLDRYCACVIDDPQMDLTAGRFGIREPKSGCVQVPLNRLDLILVPGVAFDLHGRRLGRGKGFFDRLLAEVRGTKCGIAFDEQIVDEIPIEPHDSDVNCILTPTRWIEL